MPWYCVLLIPFISIFIYICCYSRCHCPQDEDDHYSQRDLEIGIPPSDSPTRLPSFPVTYADRDDEVLDPDEIITPRRMIHEFKDMSRDCDHEAHTCCPICLEDFEPGDNVVCLSKCKHIFHPVCIDPWFQRHSHFPNCRSSVRAKGGCVEKDVEDVCVEINNPVETS